MALDIGVANLARVGDKGWVGVNNVAREIDKMWIGDENGVAREFYSGFIGRFVHIDETGPRTSVDGLEWTDDFTSTTWYYQGEGSIYYGYYGRGIAFGNETYVVAGANGKIAYSKDSGLTWTHQQLSLVKPYSSYDLNGSVSFANGKFILIYETCDTSYKSIAKVFQSTDGVTWSTVGDITANIGRSFARCIETSIVYAEYKGAKCYIVGMKDWDGLYSNGQSYFQYALWYSHDLINWTKIPNGTYMADVREIYSIDGQMYCIANSATSTGGRENVGIFFFNDIDYVSSRGSLVGVNNYEAGTSTYNYDTGEILVMQYGSSSVFKTTGMPRPILEKVGTIATNTFNYGKCEMCYGGGKYLVLSNTGDSSTDKTWASYSYDGATWTNIELPSWQSYYPPKLDYRRICICYGRT